MLYISIFSFIIYIIIIFNLINTISDNIRKDHIYNNALIKEICISKSFTNNFTYIKIRDKNISMAKFFDNEKFSDCIMTYL